MVAEPAPSPEPRRPLILVATDFSRAADAALRWAAAIAEEHGASMLLLHALPLYGATADYLPSPPEMEEHLRGAAVERLGNLAGEISPEIAVETRLEIGLPSQTVVEAARAHAADLVVVGSRGLSNLAHVLLGSTAERIVQRAPCPVLVVHPDDERHRPVRTILVPTDFSPASRRAAAAAENWLSRLEAPVRLVLLHAFHLPVEYTAYGAVPTSLHFAQDAGERAEESLATLAAELRRDGLTVDTLAREGYPPETIVAVAREIDADVIALGTHGRTGLRHLLLGSNAERVVQKAGCPVLTVRLKEDEEG
jgi:nucleotide-binding universal stress UspA family protein